MPKNKIEDLRNLMMETIEKLMDPDDPMDAKNAVAISQLGNVIVNSAKVELQAARAFGNSPTFFANGQKEVKQIGVPIDVDAEIPDCKCGEPIFPVDYERSQNLQLNYPRCRECLEMLPTNSTDLNGGGK